MHYLGEAHRLEVTVGSPDAVTVASLEAISGEQLPLFAGASLGFAKLRVVTADTHAANVQQVVEAWLREQADDYFAARLEVFANELPWLSDGPPVWRHSFMRSQWGSCSIEGKISLNTHLLKTPPALIDYVILHELCHLRHHNHGKRFYALMTKHMPDWQDRRRELNQYVTLLVH